ncbi:MAG: polyprenyl synthetase family protein [Tissierellia bacterium]|nr:polyprenyl synthetase family protein [Tissierellia bacterium]
MDDFLIKLDSEIEKINIKIEKTIDSLKDRDMETIYEGAIYATVPGGKRLRPLLLVKTYDMFAKDEDFLNDIVYPFAVAIELIHSYSLVHDDLPSMDNDSLRRGKASTHIVFGEGMAVLIGDYLLNASYEIISKALLDTSEKYPEKIDNVLQAFDIIASLSGSKGMVGGQSIDIEVTLEDYKNLGNEEGERLLSKMISLKTGGLIKASIIAGGLLGGANKEEMEILKDFSENLGMAFQITDDFLDFEEDNRARKPTYPTVLGEKIGREMAEKTKSNALKALKLLGQDTSFIEAFSKMLINREK